jgi:DNA-binding transcriptional ArsR family regulator
MATLSYTISPILREQLLEIETLKRKILLPLLSYNADISLRFDTLVQRIFFLVKPHGFTKKQIADYLLLHQASKQTIRRLHHSEERIDEFKNAYEFITIHIGISPKPVNISDILKMDQRFFGGKLKIDLAILRDMFEYLDSQSDSPVIQAALALSQMRRLQPFTRENDLMTHLVSHLYLEKGGYNFRGLVFWEEEALKEPGTFQTQLESASQKDNQTIWLEYVTRTLRDHLQHIVLRIAHRRRLEGWPTDISVEDALEDSTIDNDTVPVSVTERQRQILLSLETPGARISNKTVQALFHISQITASRDLSKLESLSLVMRHGKGRSIYYTRGV